MVVTSVGVNDVTKLMPADVWIKKQEQFYGKIQQKFNPKLVIAAGVPPMNMFPALPNPLAWLFGQYAKHMNQQLEKFVNKQINMQWIEYDIEKYRAMNYKWPKMVFIQVRKFIHFGDKKSLARSVSHSKITEIPESGTVYVGY